MHDLVDLVGSNEWLTRQVDKRSWTGPTASVDLASTGIGHIG
jgi:hypothetical protein